MPATLSVQRLRGVLSLGVGLGLFFIFLELLKAQRSSQWAGYPTAYGLGAGLALVTYALVIAAVVALVQWMGSRFWSKRSPWPIDSIALLCGGAVVWVLLSVHREETPTLDDGIVAVALVGCAAVLALGLKWSRYSTAGFGVALALVWLCGISAILSAGEYFLFSAARADEVTLYPAAWTGLCGVLTFGLLSYSRRGLTGVAVLGIGLPLLSVWALLRPGGAGVDTTRPNLVFVVADTLRADYSSVYGGAVPMPNLEGLADSGVCFDQCYALAPWTLPSMTGLLSSQYPRSLTPGSGHAVWSLQMNRYEVDTREATLPMRLEAEGYATGAVTANAFLPSIPGAMAGIQTQASSHPILLREEGYFGALPFLGALVEDWLPALAAIRPHNTTRSLDHYARAFIERNSKRPFFLWVHYIDPHAPYDPPESLRRVQEGPWPFFYPYAGGEAWNLPILGKNFQVAVPDRDYVKSLYEGEVAYIDAFAGDLLGALRDAGVADNTYVCFTSDHGEELWDHGEWGHGHALYEEQLHVPLMILGPGIVPRRVPEPVSAIDLLPTLGDVMGVSHSALWRGESLVPVLRGEKESPASKPIFAQGTTNKTETPMHMVTFEHYKLIRIAGTDSVMLFDLLADPKEQRDCAAEQPDRVAQLKQLLDAWLASFPSFFEEEEKTEFNRDLEEGLEGMGYL